MEIDIKGEVVDSATADMYDWFGMPNTNPATIQKALKDANGEDIQLNISSGGGDVSAAAEIYTMFRQYSGKVTGTIQGIAASAASVIAEACDHLVISPAASMMIHRASNWTQGNTNDFSHGAEVLDKVDQTICAVYQAKTGKSKDEILDLMDKETWMTAEDAVSEGFADEILSVKSDIAPQFVNSFTTLPSKDKVKEFKAIILSQNNKKASHISDSKSDDMALLNEKINLLKGK